MCNAQRLQMLRASTRYHGKMNWHTSGVMTLCAAHRRLVIILATTVLTAVSTFTSQCGNASAATVILSAGNNIQTAVAANPPGTTFVLRPGVYRENSVIYLKNGDRFIGDAGAIMNGAKVLTGWTQVSINGVRYWTTAGGTPLPMPRCGTPLHSCCAAGYLG